jgi:hypothetical protein
MLPGTYAYVTAGHIGRAILIDGGEGGLSVAPWQVAVGVGASLLAIGFIGTLAKRAIDEADADAAVAAPAKPAAAQPPQRRAQQAQPGWGQAPAAAPQGWQPQPAVE